MHSITQSRLIHQLIDSLPKNFSFYHLGDVNFVQEATPSFLSWEDERESLLSSDRSALSYTLSGEIQGCVLIVLEPGLDSSTYSELGNVLVSRLVDALETKHFLQVSLSPPRIITGRRLQEHLTQNRPAIHGQVEHRIQGESVCLRALVTLQGQGGGNA